MTKDLNFSDQTLFRGSVAIGKGDISDPANDPASTNWLEIGQSFFDQLGNLLLAAGITTAAPAGSTAVKYKFGTNASGDIIIQVGSTTVNLNTLITNSSTAYKGDATTATNPGAPSSPVYYYATATGTYANFKDSSNASIVVSSADFTNNKVRLSVTGAVTTKILEPSTIAIVVDNITTADGTKALSANQGKLLNDKTEPVRAIVKTNQLLNLGTALRNVGSMDGAGNPSAGTGYFNFMLPVTFGRTYKLITLSPTGVVTLANPLCVTLDANFNYVRTRAALVSNGLFTPNAGEAYLRFNDSETVSTIYMVYDTGVQTTDPTSYIPYGYYFNNVAFPINIIAADIANAIANSEINIKNVLGNGSSAPFLDAKAMKYLIPSINLYNYKDPNWVNGYLTGSGGFNAAGNWTTTHFVEIKPVTNYFWSLTPFKIDYYDKNYSFLSSAAGTQATTSPANAKFTRISYQNGAVSVPGSTVMLVEGSSYSGSFVSYGYTLNPDVIKVVDPALASTKPFASLTAGQWLACGDSMTMQGLYFPALQAITGLVNPVNAGANGQPLNGFLDAVTDAQIIAAKLITCFVGTNDFGHGSATLGSISDAKTANTIYGQVKKAIDRILTLNPTVRLVFFTPTNRGAYGSEPADGTVPNGYGLTIQNIGQAMMDTCKLLGVPCEDTGGKSGINQYNLNTMTADYLHIVGVGAARVGAIMGNYINRVGA